MCVCKTMSLGVVVVGVVVVERIVVTRNEIALVFPLSLFSFCIFSPRGLKPLLSLTKNDDDDETCTTYCAQKRKKRSKRYALYLCVCVCLNPRLCEMRFGFFSKKGISYSMFFALLRKRKKDERKKKFLVPTDVFEFFSEEEKSKLCRFVFLPSSWVFIFDFGPRIQFGHLSSSASHKRSLQHFKRRKLRHKKSERIRCSSSFLFAKVGVLDAWTITTRAFTRTRGKGDETLEF